MDLASFKLLFSKVGGEALAAAVQLQPKETDYLRYFQKLEKQFPGKLAQAALEIAILRKEADKKFPHAERMFFTREALEQASPDEVSKHRTARYREFSHLVDLGCSIGSDTLNMGRMAHTTGIDIDALRLAMAQSNAEALGLADQIDFIRADLNAPLPIEGSESCGLFFDPARRAAGRRVYSVKDYEPPLEIVSSRLDSFPAIGVKISPGVDKSELADFDAELEFVSLGGELKEALLWFGPLKTAKRRATILPGPHSLTGDEEIGSLPLSEPKGYIYEPDAAVIRAGLVAKLGDQLGAFQLDPDIAYMTEEEEIPNPFSKVWKIEDWLPFNLKRLREYLRARDVGEVTVKKRGSPLQPEELIRMLRLRGDDQRVLFLTHLDGAPITIVCYQPKPKPSVVS
jgi:hypothetical protein